MARAKAEAAIHVDFERIWVMTKLLCYFTGTSEGLSLTANRPMITAMIDKYQPPSFARQGTVWIRVFWGALLILLHSALHVTRCRVCVVSGVVFVVAMALRYLR